MISGFADFFNINHLDMSSDANDVIVVHHPDGRLHSTDFNVRFGKVKVLRPGDKVVRIEVNGQMTSAIMKIGPNGEAFWLKTTCLLDGDCGRPESPVFASDDSQDTGASITSAGGGELPVKSLRHRLFGSWGKNKFNGTQDDPETRSHQPLIKQDCDGRLHVNTQAQCSGADAVELHLAEETVVAAERAMQEIKRLSHQNPDYLRDVVMGDTEGEACLQELSGFQDYTRLMVDTTEGSSTAVNSTEITVGVPDDVTQMVQVETSTQGGDGSFSDVAALGSSASDEGLEASADDYIFEDVHLPADTDEGVTAGCSGTPPCGSCTPARSVAPVTPVPDVCASNPPSPCGPTPEGQGAVSQQNDVPSKATASNYSGSGTNDLNSNGITSSDGTYFTRSLVPMEADLLKLNLVPGHNRIRYITHSSLRGEVAVEANVYLWDSTDRLVISDVDGTITKSDVLGHIMPLIGRDWTHPGICSLYSQIQKNGYRLVYLTARSVSQISMTRKFLWNIQQNGVSLPKGPVLTAPKRLFSALAQEVAMKSHFFKIACLQKVVNAFPQKTKPFYAGFGNRLSDMLSYLAVMVPEHKIYVVDSKSLVRVANVTSTYQRLADDVDSSFPPIVRRHNLSYAQFGLGCSAGAHNGGATFKGSEGEPFSDGRRFSSYSSGDKFSPTPTGITNTASFSSQGTSTHPLSALGNGLGLADIDARGLEMSGMSNPSASVAVTNRTNDPTSTYKPCDVVVDREFDSFVYWRAQPTDMIEGESSAFNTKAATNLEQKDQQPRVINEKKASWLPLGLGNTSSENYQQGDTV
ncbi:lipin, putative [Trypanosoma equiperdum]|uniref:Lipin, putative n=1 Tax=Trypanosoma equiperdum TaxID=5694 RepID=A0A1G4IJN8_TRYEQ|nr:lipin, putative [Trypanosoma equiperdum]